MRTKKTKKKKRVNKKANTQKYTNEIYGVVLLSIGVLLLLSLYTDNSIGLFGTFIKEVFLGLIGLSAYIMPPLMVVYSILYIFGKNSSGYKIKIVYAMLLLVLISAFIHSGNYRVEDSKNIPLFKYIIKIYLDGNKLIGGGLLGGIISVPFLLAFGNLGTIIILTTLSIIDIMLLTNISIANLVNVIKGVINNSINKYKERKKNEKIEFHPEYENDVELKVKSRPQIIDFIIEKDSRSHKDGAENINKAITHDVQIHNINTGNEKSEPKKQVTYDDTDCESIPGYNIDLYKKHLKEYKYPSLTLLSTKSGGTGDIRAYKAKAIEKAKLLEETLKSFGVVAKVINICRGPTVTRYELQPSPGVKVSKIVNLADDISLNLASSGVRIEAPIPGKAAIGIEVPNNEIAEVSLKEVIQSQKFKKHPSKLAFAIGKDISGECIVADIAKMPHLLIAGATGSGKSVCINSIIISLLYKASPNEVKLLMIDPKVVELGGYNSIPHLLIPVVTDPKKAAGALNWAVQEMTNRYKLFAEKSVRDIKSYNNVLKNEQAPEYLPQIVIIIDELADLMMVAPGDVEDSICRLAQMARAAGMHLVIATQRPSVNVITGVIKANIPSRISFAVSSNVDSRTILDMPGAEKLLGKGDMLFYPVGSQKPVRVQGALVSEKEVEKVVEFLKSQAEAQYDNDIIEELNKQNDNGYSLPDDKDELLPKAIELVVNAGQASVSLIQRKFRVGYARAARIIDQMEERGIVGGFEGSKPRKVVITKQQWQEIQLSDSSISEDKKDVFKNILDIKNKKV